MRCVASALGFLVLAALPTSADEPPDFDKLTEVAERAKPARDRWERCTAFAARRELRSAVPSAAVAQRALARCAREEAKLRAFLTKEVGAKVARGTMAELRDLQQSNLIQVIEALRKARR